MKSYGILFSPAMVLAILAGRKHVTRRIDMRWRRVKAGDELWGRETWRPVQMSTGVTEVQYSADGHCEYFTEEDISPEWTIPKAASTGNVSPLFMPRWASRIALVATEDAWAERLQDITEADAKAEGAPLVDEVTGRESLDVQRGSYRLGFQALWETLHDKPGERWADNPEVVRLGF